MRKEHALFSQILPIRRFGAAKTTPKRFVVCTQVLYYVQNGERSLYKMTDFFLLNDLTILVSRVLHQVVKHFDSKSSFKLLGTGYYTTKWASPSVWNSFEHEKYQLYHSVDLEISVRVRHFSKRFISSVLCWTWNKTWYTDGCFLEYFLD